jgi:Alpha/beta hydrolase domain
VLLGFLPARQPDGRFIRLWEVAGTAHGDTYLLAAGPDDPGPGATDTTYLPPVSSIFGGIISCAAPMNAGPQHYVVSAALHRLNRWARQRRARGKSAPRMEVTAGPPPAIARDALGNALGGIRMPAVEVPIAAYSGLGQTGSSFCFLFGTTTPFDDGTLAALYPSHAAYVAAVRKAAGAARRAGFLLRPDLRTIRRAAAASDVGQ